MKKITKTSLKIGKDTFPFRKREKKFCIKKVTKFVEQLLNRLQLISELYILNRVQFLIKEKFVLEFREKSFPLFCNVIKFHMFAR